MNLRDLHPGVRVRMVMGVPSVGTIIMAFYWRESTDGTYSPPPRGYVPIKWDNGTKGYCSAEHVTLATTPRPR